MSRPCAGPDLHRAHRGLVGCAATYTIVIVTHNMQQAARVSQHTYMYLGELVEFRRRLKSSNETEGQAHRGLHHRSFRLGNFMEHTSKQFELELEDLRSGNLLAMGGFGRGATRAGAGGVASGEHRLVRGGRARGSASAMPRSARPQEHGSDRQTATGGGRSAPDRLHHAGGERS